MRQENGITPCGPRDMFEIPQAAGTRQIVLELRRIPAPRRLTQKSKKDLLNPRDNFHIPSFKNSKRWITKLPNGKPLKRPILITSPEFQQWREKAIQLLESSLLSLCRTGGDGTPLEPSTLFATPW